MAEKVEILLRVNGEARRVAVWPMERLLDALRDGLGLKGTKEGCGEGECGACAVIMNGKLVTSCLIPALEADGASITTIEGLSEGPELCAIQRAFIEEGAAQCGFCTPGMIVAASSLCKGGEHRDNAELREGLAGNLCRCTGHVKILAAVRKAAGWSEA